MTDAYALAFMENFVRQEKRQLQLQIGLSNGNLSYEISNTNDESLPLSGWTWDDPGLHTGEVGATLTEAWDKFYTALANARKAKT